MAKAPCFLARSWRTRHLMDTLVATAFGWPANLAHLLARFIWLIPRSQEPGAGSQMTHASCLTAVSITPSVIINVLADHVGVTAAVSSAAHSPSAESRWRRYNPATRKAKSRDWLRLSRGSHAVS